MSKHYDLVVLGGGTGGYVAAIRASQLGLKTALVEKHKLGGTCLHTGCIPSKSLLRSAEVYATAKNSEQYGIEIPNVKFDFIKIQARKNKIIKQLQGGVEHLVKKGKIDVFYGHGRLLGPSIFSPIAGTVSIEMNNKAEGETLISKNVIIATGSRPRQLDGLEFDGQFIISSDDALQLEKLPKSIIIVGGGVIGLEWASLLSDFGVEVTILEYAKQIAPTEDKEVARELQRLFKRKKIKIITEAEVLPETNKTNNDITLTANVKGKEQQFTAEKVLVSVGRSANTENIGLENTDIKIELNTIVTNEFYQTAEQHIYAIGDVIGGLQLAHVASREGINAVEHIAGEDVSLIDYKNVPRCIYTSPEIASIGYTEVEAINAGYEVKVGKFSFRANGKALVFGQYDGFAKVIANKNTNDLLGVHIIGPHATDLISEAGLAQILDATPWEIAKLIHPHPTLSEVLGEAAQDVDGLAIHI